MSLRLDYPSADLSAQPSRLVEGSLDRDSEILWGPRVEYSGGKFAQGPPDVLRVMLYGTSGIFGCCIPLVFSDTSHNVIAIRLWACCGPLRPSAIMAAAVTLGQRARVSALSPTDVPGQFYAVFGIILLQTFLEALNTQWSLFRSNQDLLTRPGPHVEASLLCGIYENFIQPDDEDAVNRRHILLCNVHPSNTVVLGFGGMLLILLIGTSIGLLLSPWSAFVSDLEHARMFVPWLVFGATPVFVEPSGNFAPLVLFPVQSAHLDLRCGSTSLIWACYRHRCLHSFARTVVCRYIGSGKLAPVPHCTSLMSFERTLV